ncbi:hypothetical protein AC623_07740 [Bacillus sp. FJAT-27231]|uniref:hypothetical protein n=1 Tax=Bacillus sp. FJAT-27231 TaxID=1679168 RepID=UPI0006711FF1|nr:hypothetical protein [Bacillus sp. FJAT-27231]KMY53874.1 hypothetical protein AC623_07740 [Bacillus sp. FJAT-27231]
MNEKLFTVWKDEQTRERKMSFLQHKNSGWANDSYTQSEQAETEVLDGVFAYFIVGWSHNDGFFVPYITERAFFII